MKDTIYREDAIKALSEVFTECEPCDKEEAVDIAVTTVKEIPSADRPSEIIYGNENNCIMTIFGECSYAETGCGDCAVVEKVRKALSTDGPQGEWIPCSERLPMVGESVLFSVADMYVAEGCLRDDGDWWQFRWKAIRKANEVTAWMPLPKPWKGADDE